MTVTKKCTGCQLLYETTSYHRCHISIGIYSAKSKKWINFRDNYCPCTNCLVKAICKEPKVIVKIGSAHPCTLFREQIIKFRNEVMVDITI